MLIDIDPQLIGIQDIDGPYPGAISHYLTNLGIQGGQLSIDSGLDIEILHASLNNYTTCLHAPHRSFK